MDYTPKQMEYIDSVEGKAHASAVLIIGGLENELQAVKASKLVFVPAMSDDMAETYLAENIQLNAEIAGLQERVKELEGALGRIHTCAKDIIAEDDEDINLKAEWVMKLLSKP